MALPGILSSGYLSMYGVGSNTGINGVVAPSGFSFNYIYGMWSEEVGAQVGDSILFKDSDVVCWLAYSNGNYPILPTDKIIFVENPIIPDP